MIKRDAAVSFAFLCGFFILNAFCALVSATDAQVTAIHAGKLIDPDSGAVLIGQTIIVRDGKIESVGNNLTIPSNAKIIDLSKMTVLPGLIDCHTHLADGARDSEPMDQFKKTAARIALESVPNARAMLESGFTSVRDVGTYRALGDIALRDAIQLCGRRVRHHLRRGRRGHWTCS
jgi:imidazolonepropionase-like amidohydrolase